MNDKKKRLLKQLSIFFLLCFIIAWTTWFTSFAHPETLRLLSFIGLFAPAIAAFVVAGSFDKTGGIKNLMSRYLIFRFNISWYFLSVLLIPFLFLLAMWLDGLFFKTNFSNVLLSINPVFLFVSFIWLMFINSGEEIGWRGFALPKLQLLLNNPLSASFILGIFWSVWHLPIYLMPGQSSIPLPAFLFFTTGLSFIYTVVFIKCKGSLVTAVLLHASTDFMPRIINITVFKPSTWIIFGILVWLSAVVLFITVHIFKLRLDE